VACIPTDRRGGMERTRAKVSTGWSREENGQVVDIGCVKSDIEESLWRRLCMLWWQA